LLSRFCLGQHPRFRAGSLQLPNEFRWIAASLRQATRGGWRISWEIHPVGTTSVVLGATPITFLSMSPRENHGSRGRVNVGRACTASPLCRMSVFSSAASSASNWRSGAAPSDVRFFLLTTTKALTRPPIFNLRPPSCATLVAWVVTGGTIAFYVRPLEQIPSEVPGGLVLSADAQMVRTGSDEGVAK